MLLQCQNTWLAENVITVSKHTVSSECYFSVKIINTMWKQTENNKHSEVPANETLL